MNALARHIRMSPLLSALPREVQAELQKAAEQVCFRRRHVVFVADQRSDYVYLLCSGLVKLARTSPSGRDVSLSLVNPYEIFGENDIFDSGAYYGATAEVLVDSEVVSFRRCMLAGHVGNSPEALIALAHLQYTRRSYAEQRLVDISFYDVPTRLARLLFRLSAANGGCSIDNIGGRLKLTHQEIANLIGSTRETTTVVLGDLRRKGIIQLIGRRIIISDPHALREMTEGKVER